MAQLGPLTITARNREQAVYLVRSRAEQRGVTITDVEATDAGAGRWLVTVTLADAAAGAAARLEDDTQVLHIDFAKIAGHNRNTA